MTPKIHRGRAIVLALLVCVGTGPVLAQDNNQEILVRGRPLPEGTEQRIVRISDLDLRKEEGTREMERRVRLAIADICDQASSPEITEQMLDKKCRDGAWNDARPQMDRAIQWARATQ